ncbi:XRE family transcriptional regulator [Photobacterium sanctipauli]|uniref:XRE family transcriptional regulator n=1 Tax=Photobacterium sanctipauli TaxID=1342794 RepID=A0A2T3P153_9GAMM|nr:helix-turn-helix transcriptional regulator [Photobacterium sanctipauli]PSW22244.1 XRE family transcriptional regulator [Photobacterium sanctipauli]
MDYFCFEAIKDQLSPRFIAFDDTECVQHVGNNLRQFRTATQLTQQSQANAMQVSIAQYRKYERGIDLPKMHSAARWSVLFGAPISLLFRNTCYQATFDEQPAPYFFGVYHAITHASPNTFQALLQLTNEITGQPLEHCFRETPESDIQQVLGNIDEHYYTSVAKNLLLIRQSLSFSQEKMAELLGLSLSTYKQYEKLSNTPKIPVTFSARTHAILGLESQWAETGSSPFAIFSRRRRQRLDLLRPVFSQASAEQQQRLCQLYQSVFHLTRG